MAGEPKRGLAALLERRREHGSRAAWNALRSILVNRFARLANRLLPPRYECPCCGMGTWRFLDHDVVGYVKRNSICPSCGSHEKHRAAWLALCAELPSWPAGTRILHVAPEAVLAPLFARRPDMRRVRLDLHMTGVDVRADLTSLPFPAASFDRLLVFHVLDYIPDDRAALRELRRVAASGAVLDLVLPLNTSGVTEELPTPDPLDSFHIRRYGPDVVERVREAGFEILQAPTVPNVPRASASLRATWIRARRPLP